jgi:hypothetical protein
VDDCKSQPIDEIDECDSCLDDRDNGCLNCVPECAQLVFG